MIKEVEILVSGKVQGVFYRESTKAQALELGIKGTVKNLPSLTEVLIRAQGEEQQLSEFIGWCHTGPPAAIVQKVEVVDVPLEEYEGFAVIR